MSTLRKDGRLQSSVTITNPYTGVNTFMVIQKKK